MNVPGPEWDAVLNAPGFALGVRASEGAVVAIGFLSPQAAQPPRNALAADAVAQLAAYLQDPAFRFTLPVAAGGSGHQQRVWRVMQDIPCGETLTYGDVARRIGSSARAVGGACGANPLPVVIPCHRVIASGGAPGGFARSTHGFLPGIKRWLLAHESATRGFTLSANDPVLS